MQRKGRSVRELPKQHNTESNPCLVFGQLPHLFGFFYTPFNTVYVACFYFKSYSWVQWISFNRSMSLQQLPKSQNIVEQN